MLPRFIFDWLCKSTLEIPFFLSGAELESTHAAPRPEQVEAVSFSAFGSSDFNTALQFTWTWLDAKTKAAMSTCRVMAPTIRQTNVIRTWTKILKNVLLIALMMIMFAIGPIIGRGRASKTSKSNKVQTNYATMAKHERRGQVYTNCYKAVCWELILSRWPNFPWDTPGRP